MDYPNYDSVTPRSQASIEAWEILVLAFISTPPGRARFVLSRALWHNRGNGCRNGGNRSSVPVRGVKND
jgi:hypothetical protein